MFDADGAVASAPALCLMVAPPPPSHSGCLTQEKIVAGCAKHFVVIADYRLALAG